MDIIVAKILTAVLLFIVTMVFSLIPYYIIVRGSKSEASVERRQWILGHLNCFAGGVFLATLLCHILAEGGETFEDWKVAAGKDWDFPLFNIFVAVGFFLVAFVEVAAKRFMAKKKVEDANGQNAIQNTNNVDGDSAPQRMDFSENPESQIAHEHAVKPEGLRAFLLLIALSFHTIFDGLAIGLQDKDSEVWVVFAAITIHKSVIAFCIGLEIFQSSKNKFIQALIWLIIFAIMSPVGVGVGIAVTTGSTNELARLLISSILQGMSGGTFMYVTFLEILCLHIGHHGQGNVFHIIWALIGFSAMAATKLFDRD